MLRLTFEAYTDSLPELKKELEDILWKIDHVWPMTIPKNVYEIKERIDIAKVTLSRGAVRLSIDPVKSIHDHKKDCPCCTSTIGDTNNEKRKNK